MLYTLLLLIVSILGLAYVDPAQGQIVDNAIITNYQEEQTAQQAHANTPLLPSATVTTSSSSAVTASQEEEEEPQAYELKDMHAGPLKHFKSDTDEYHRTFLTEHHHHEKTTTTTPMQRDKILFVILTIATVIVWGIIAFQLLGFRSISSEAIARHNRRQFYSPLPGQV